MAEIARAIFDSSAELLGDIHQIATRNVHRHRRRGLAGVRAVFVDARDVSGAQAAFACRGQGRANAPRPSCSARAAGRAPRRPRDRRAASACSRRQFRRRGSRPTEDCCDARDRPSARCCRSSTGASLKLRLSRAIAAGTSGHASRRCQARLSSRSAVIGQSAQAEARQDALEIAPVQHVELGERNAAGAHLFHAGLVFAAPGVGKRDPVELMAKRREHASPPRARSKSASPSTCRTRRRTELRQPEPDCLEPSTWTFGNTLARSNRACQTAAKSLKKWRERRDSNPRPLP